MAILTLAEAIDLRAVWTWLWAPVGVRAACLPDRRDFNGFNDATVLKASGWGKRKGRNTDEVYTVDVRYVSPEATALKRRDWWEARKGTNFCFGAPISSTQSGGLGVNPVLSDGDSGGDYRLFQ